MFSPTTPHGQGPSPATLFTDPAAVDAWDRWFRWREDGVLRDLTIDSTWWRVANAVAQVEGDQAATWARQLVDAFSRWRVLPDPRLLRRAGAKLNFADMKSPCAVVNAGAFIVAKGLKRACFERDGFVDSAALAVRLLDDVLRAGDPAGTRAQARIGLIGVADALDSLGLPYNSSKARQCAADMAAALADGVLRGATAQNFGMRHELLTTIEPQPQLALLANNASDALDPRPGQLEAEALIVAQVEMRAAMQPWIDIPIDYPLVCAGEPDLHEIDQS
jgi:ribonucleoside-diphosphate reductase alpha chain